MMQSNSDLLEAAYKDIYRAAENGNMKLRSGGDEIHQRRLDALSISLAKATPHDQYGQGSTAENLQIQAEWIGEKGILEGLTEPPVDVYLEVEGEKETWRLTQPWDGEIDIESPIDEPPFIRFDYEWTQVERL